MTDHTHTLHGKWTRLVKVGFGPETSPDERTGYTYGERPDGEPEHCGRDSIREETLTCRKSLAPISMHPDTLPSYPL